MRTLKLFLFLIFCAFSESFVIECEFSTFNEIYGYTCNALLSHVYSNLDNKKQTAIVFIDLMKAFDSLDHKILLTKLSKISLPLLLFQTLKDYLCDRKQFVQIDDVKSSLLPVTTGVFQGAKLAACLFIFYINSIFTLPLRGQLILYADDIAIVYGAPNDGILKRWIEEDLILINCWVENHFMKINSSKTKILHFFGNAYDDYFLSDAFTINFRGVRIEKVSHFDYLGLLIDDRLKFTKHLDVIRNRVISMSFAIRRIRPYITLHTAKQLYFARIHSLLIYLNSCWSVGNKTDIERLARGQRKVLRFVFQKNYDSPSIELFSEKLLPLNFLNNYQTLLLTYKFVRGLSRSNVEINIRRSITNRETRQSNSYYIPNDSRTSYGIKKFFKRGLDIFNKLPSHLRVIRSLDKFKSELKEYLYDLYVRKVTIY